ncbi:MULTISPECIES: hypothetical protein [Oerskovia]|uniref:Antitoxin n=1 Tax=Oerskovia enterophila TaxID=43678 RepID=A0A163RMX3_9CELL|nr:MULTISPECIES: hypothetical protein [Oerskovia]KRC35718.1 hypothetical protein ASE15_11570 [Oerskovia sp. Root22]KRD36355.1 hypothetical protein ASE27_12265 [Oerskovia sp. Root918]KZM35383.1 hypothetical protein OJAG_19880 [Oerskovia enterophila]OCI31945.1 hypothetical protein OERS_12780 [Oerskovia enterophila]
MGIDEAKDKAAAAAGEAKEGLGGLLDKAKEFLTDDRIDDVAEKIKGIAPDSVDGHVDTLAEKAKEVND